MGPIYHLLYTSRCTQPLSEKQMGDLLKASIAWNAKVHITGFLIVREGYFMQLLEGAKDPVLELFTRIELDTRHEDVTIQAEGSSQTRIAPDWHMQKIKLVPNMPRAEELLEVYRRGREALPYTHREEMMRLLDQFTAAVYKKSS